MKPSAARSEAGTDAADPPVAGTIRPAESDLRAAVDDWLRHLRGRRHKKTGYEAYRQKVERFIRETGVRSCAELTASSLMGWLDSHGERWSGATYNNALSVLRSLTGYLVGRGVLADDPLAATVRAFEEAGNGSRAATTEEARAILAVAVARQTSDARCKGDRALYWLSMFLAGCRLDEPGRWRWRHLLLDEARPVVRWTPEINKNRRLEEVAMHPELAALLREHRESMRALAAVDPVVRRLYRGEVIEERRIDPADPEAYVFGRVPTPASFPRDRDRAGVARYDSRGRGLTSHSARKWFATTLTLAGVPPRLVDRMARHKGGVQGRYFDPPSEELAEAVALLPGLWPPRACAGAPGVDNSCTTAVGPRIQPQNLTDRGRMADDGSRACIPAHPDPDPSPGPGRRASAGTVARPRGPGTERGCTPEPPVRRPEQVESLETPSHSMALSGLVNATDSTALVADLLEVIARLLRSGAARVDPGDHEGRDTA